jgi:hypothetical protein
MYFVWRLAGEVVAPVTALVSVLALEGLHFFNFSVVKFAHDQMQLPFWALTGWFFYRGVARGRIGDWIGAGAFLALAFWSKYAAFVLAATLVLFLLFDPIAHRSLRTPGPYAMALAFLLVISPHLYWLVGADFAPSRYVDMRAPLAARWYDYLWFPLRWSVGQAWAVLPALAMLATFLAGGGWRALGTAGGDPSGRFGRRYLLVLALGPFLVTTITAGVLGRLPLAMWGYPLWSFLPLAIVARFPAMAVTGRLRRFAQAFLVVFAAFPLAYAAIEVFEPLLRDRPKATQFPGRLMAETITRQWRERTGTPLAYVGGSKTFPPGTGEFAANNLAVYSPDRPQVIVHGDLNLSPWIDRAELARRGAVLVWEIGDVEGKMPAELHAAYPAAELQTPWVLPRQTLVPRRPALVGYAFVPPQP